MKKIVTFLLLLIGLNNLFAQTADPFIFSEIDKIKGEVLNIDNRGNIYIISETTLYKYSIEGKLLYSYTNNMLGRIKSIDVTSPFKILVFYEETESILFLDEQLIPITETIDLVSKQCYSIQAAAFSTNNQIWLYDAINNDLLQLDFYFNEINKIHLNFSNLQPLQLLFISSKNLILQDATSGILFFDAFGTYLKTLPIIAENIMQIDESTISYLKDNNLHLYNYIKMDEKIIPLSIEKVKQTVRYRDKLIVLQENGTVLISK